MQIKVSNLIAAPCCRDYLSLVCWDSHLVTLTMFNPGDVIPATGGAPQAAICALPTLTLPLPLHPLMTERNRED